MIFGAGQYNARKLSIYKRVIVKDKANVGLSVKRRYNNIDGSDLR